MSPVVLDVRDLTVHYHTRRGPVRAVDHLTFTLSKGERLGLVGESGSGKTTTALALMRLVKAPGRIETGSVLLDGRDLLQLSEEEMRRIRAAEISMVPQGAMNSLNPVMRVRGHILDTLIAHQGRRPGEDLNRRARDLLTRVGLDPGAADMYPHELSGGMKQRVVIALAIALEPAVIVADEPTSALDVVVQMQVMATLEQVQREIGASVILVGHDMGLMAQFCDRIGVMYAGKLVELGPVAQVFEEPLHPYTRLLISSLPDLERRGRFKGIPGLPPSLLDLPAGCAFHPRCPQVMPECRTVVPRPVQASEGRVTACHLYQGEPA